MKKILTLAALTAFAALTLTGCSFSAEIGDMKPVKPSNSQSSTPLEPVEPMTPAESPSVASVEVEKQAAAAIASQVEGTPAFDCSENLPAVVGASIECPVTIGATTYSSTITVTSVDENLNVKFNVDVPDYKG